MTMYLFIILFVFDSVDAHWGGTSGCSTSGIWRGCKQLFWSIFFSFCKTI